MFDWLKLTFWLMYFNADYGKKYAVGITTPGGWEYDGRVKGFFVFS